MSGARVAAEVDHDVAAKVWPARLRILVCKRRRCGAGVNLAKLEPEQCEQPPLDDAGREDAGELLPGQRHGALQARRGLPRLVVVVGVRDVHGEGYAGLRHGLHHGHPQVSVDDAPREFERRRGDLQDPALGIGRGLDRSEVLLNHGTDPTLVEGSDEHHGKLGRIAKAGVEVLASLCGFHLANVLDPQRLALERFTVHQVPDGLVVDGNRVPAAVANSFLLHAKHSLELLGHEHTLHV
mmetsp:Transcript_6524/g.28692  ORF Transcript_6524/g.28692 Transcript_6524/m.28692 type:complete len:239 (+) Transcript_6524:498-1214(+)